MTLALAGGRRHLASTAAVGFGRDVFPPTQVQSRLQLPLPGQSPYSCSPCGEIVMAYSCPSCGESLLEL